MQQNSITAIRCNIAHPETGAAAKYLTLHSIRHQDDCILTEWNAYVSCARAAEGYQPLFRFQVAFSAGENTSVPDWAYRCLIDSGTIPDAQAVFATAEPSV